MKTETIERYLDECGITPGPFERVHVSNDVEKVCYFSNKHEGLIEVAMFRGEGRIKNADAFSASREMLKALIGQTMRIIKHSREYSDPRLDPCWSFVEENIPIIESALPGRTWPEIKTRLEEIEEEEK